MPTRRNANHNRFSPSSMRAFKGVSHHFSEAGAVERVGDSCQDHGNVQGRQLAGGKRREEHPRLVPATAPHYNLVHELHEMGIIRVVHVPGKEKEADFLTKTNITEMKFKQVAHTLSSNGEKFLKKIHSSMLSTCKTSSFRDLKSGI